MKKKVVILNGSPRKNGNTSALCHAFAQGAEMAGHTVTEFFLSGMNFSGCKGCFSGGKNPDRPCVQKDDMEQIYPAYQDADLVVLASPLYYWHISGQLKCAFDRLFAVAECDKNYRNPEKSCALLMLLREMALMKLCYGIVTFKSTSAGRVLAKSFVPA